MILELSICEESENDNKILGRSIVLCLLMLFLTAGQSRQTARCFCPLLKFFLFLFAFVLSVAKRMPCLKVMDLLAWPMKHICILGFSYADNGDLLNRRMIDIVCYYI